MPELLRRVRDACTTRPWHTLCAWLLVVLAIAATNTLLSAHPDDAGPADARVVIRDEHGQPLRPSVLSTVRGRLGALAGVAGVDSARVSADLDTALFTVRYRTPAGDPDAGRSLAAATAPARDAGLRVELAGSALAPRPLPVWLANAVGGMVALALLVPVLWRRRRRPHPIVAALAALVLLSAPALLLRPWWKGSNATVQRADRLIAAEFGPGANTPLLLVVDLTRTPSTRALLATVSAWPGVARVADPVVSADHKTATVLVEPSEPGTNPLLGTALDGARVVTADPPGAPLAVVGLMAGASLLACGLCFQVGTKSTSTADRPRPHTVTAS